MAWRLLCIVHAWYCMRQACHSLCQAKLSGILYTVTKRCGLLLHKALPASATISNCVRCHLLQAMAQRCVSEVAQSSRMTPMQQLVSVTTKIGVLLWLTVNIVPSPQSQSGLLWACLVRHRMLQEKRQQGAGLKAKHEWRTLSAVPEHALGGQGSLALQGNVDHSLMAVLFSHCV